MTVADKLLQVNQVKQNIKNAIETKGVPMTNVAFTDYANKILDISGGGGGWDISYEEYALALYYRFGKLAIFSNAWQDMEDSETVLFDIPLMLITPEEEGDIYVGTNGQLQALYDACVNETIIQNRVYYVNNVAIKYNGDISADVEFPIPLYGFGDLSDYDNISFVIGDFTILEMGFGLALTTMGGNPIPNNNIVIQQGCEFENENGIIIPNSVTNIGWGAFNNWTSNNQPLVIPNSVTNIGEFAFNNWNSNNQPLIIPNSVTSIGGAAFQSWSSNNQPLIIPNSVTSIGEQAFYNWTSNNQPLVIPDSVTSIGYGAFGSWSLVPYIEIQATTPPTLASNSAFAGQNNAPIYVPDESVNDYKTATNWVSLASRIFPISDK